MVRRRIDPAISPSRRSAAAVASPPQPKSPRPMPTLTGIHHENEFYSHHYLAEILAGNIQATLERWRKEAEASSTVRPKQNSGPLRPITSASAASSRPSGARASASSGSASGSGGCCRRSATDPSPRTICSKTAAKCRSSAPWAAPAATRTRPGCSCSAPAIPTAKGKTRSPSRPTGCSSTGKRRRPKLSSPNLGLRLSMEYAEVRWSKRRGTP